ncbi:hypothetical protein [Streptomyces pinistramenti]|uniref:hypothetical protein n=1 Tax=Streptomyces pinistramenti TaxID=2884812 RepID=UPI001D080C0E|nr:hypothetical protein [Streptomyces pinistramenti]MCB5907406.1 hypothetical protein [Streptomyces pinistramenti]
MQGGEHLGRPVGVEHDLRRVFGEWRQARAGKSSSGATLGLSNLEIRRSSRVSAGSPARPNRSRSVTD